MSGWSSPPDPSCANGHLAIPKLQGCLFVEERPCRHLMRPPWLWSALVSHLNSVRWAPHIDLCQKAKVRWEFYRSYRIVLSKLASQ